METKTIKQNITFKAHPGELYEMIMDAKKHSQLVGGKVKMSRKINGQFDVFDGYCKGYNIELIKDIRIVQAWNFLEDGWPADHYSICTFEFEKMGKQTKMRFTQTHVPAHKAEALKDGWKTYYWNPIKQMLII
jgi:activator of HSP90 ATPase